jgi:hypothetical protein
MTQIQNPLMTFQRKWNHGFEERNLSGKVLPTCLDSRMVSSLIGQLAWLYSDIQLMRLWAKINRF